MSTSLLNAHLARCEAERHRVAWIDRLTLELHDVARDAPRPTPPPIAAMFLDLIADREAAVARLVAAHRELLFEISRVPPPPGVTT